MARISRKGLAQFPDVRLHLDEGQMDQEWRGWLTALVDSVPYFRSKLITLDPVLVAANTTAEEEVEFKGVTTNDLICVNKPTHTTGLTVTAYAKSDNTVGILFTNNTGSGINPGSEVYKVYVMTI